MVSIHMAEPTIGPTLRPTIQSNIAKPIQFTGFAAEITRYSITL